MKDAVPDLYILKDYCYSFHLVAGHACETLSNTAEQLTHEIHNFLCISIMKHYGQNWLLHKQSSVMRNGECQNAVLKFQNTIYQQVN